MQNPAAGTRPASNERQRIDARPGRGEAEAAVRTLLRYAGASLAMIGNPPLGAGA